MSELNGHCARAILLVLCLALLALLFGKLHRFDRSVWSLGELQRGFTGTRAPEQQKIENTVQYDDDIPAGDATLSIASMPASNVGVPPIVPLEWPPGVRQPVRNPRTCYEKSFVPPKWKEEARCTISRLEGMDVPERVICSIVELQGDCFFPESMTTPWFDVEKHFPYLSSTCNAASFLGVNTPKLYGTTSFFVPDHEEAPALESREEIVNVKCLKKPLNSSQGTSSHYLTPQQVLAVMQRRGWKKMLFSGDSMMRQFFLRLVEIVRSMPDPVGAPPPPVIERYFHADAAYQLLRVGNEFVDHLTIHHILYERVCPAFSSVEDYFASFTGFTTSSTLNKQRQPHSSTEVVLELHFLWDPIPDQNRITSYLNKSCRVGKYDANVIFRAYWWHKTKHPNVIIPVLEHLDEYDESKMLIFLTAPLISKDNEETKMYNAKLRAQGRLFERWCQSVEGRRPCWVIDLAAVIDVFERRALQAPLFPYKDQQELKLGVVRQYRPDGIHFMCTFYPHINEEIKILKDQPGTAVNPTARCHDDVNLAAWQWILQAAAHSVK